MIVAVRRTDGRVGFAAVVRAVETDVGDVDGVRLERVREDARVVPGALAKDALVVDLSPGFAGVFRSEHAPFFSFHQRPHAVGVHRRYGHADAADHAFGHARRAREIGPGFARVGGFEEAAGRAAGFKIPGRPVDFPEAGVEGAGVAGIEDEFHCARLRSAGVNLFPCLAAVDGLVDSAFLVGAELVAQGGDVDDVGILRMDLHRADLLGLFEAQVFPCPAAVVRFVDAVAGGGIAPNIGFAHADIDNAGVGLGDRDGPDGAGLHLAVREGFPGGPGVSGFPDAAARGAEIIRVGLRRYAGYGDGASAAERPDAAVLQFFQSVQVNLGDQGRGE